jgi:hypothetical protein
MSRICWVCYIEGIQHVDLILRVTYCVATEVQLAPVTWRRKVNPEMQDDLGQ